MIRIFKVFQGDIAECGCDIIVNSSSYKSDGVSTVGPPEPAHWVARSKGLLALFIGRDKSQAGEWRIPYDH